METLEHNLDNSFSKILQSLPEKKPGRPSLPQDEPEFFAATDKTASPEIQPISQEEANIVNNVHPRDGNVQPNAPQIR
jgi:hypothetical protein